MIAIIQAVANMSLIRSVVFTKGWYEKLFSDNSHSQARKVLFGMFYTIFQMHKTKSSNTGSSYLPTLLKSTLTHSKYSEFSLSTRQQDAGEFLTPFIEDILESGYYKERDEMIKTGTEWYSKHMTKRLLSNIPSITMKEFIEMQYKNSVMAHKSIFGNSCSLAKLSIKVCLSCQQNTDVIMEGVNYVNFFNLNHSNN